MDAACLRQSAEQDLAIFGFRYLCQESLVRTQLLEGFVEHWENVRLETFVVIDLGLSVQRHPPHEPVSILQSLFLEKPNEPCCYVVNTLVRIPANQYFPPSFGVSHSFQQG